MQGTILGQSGGKSKINGVIEQYKVASGGNINIGDFVEFANSYSSGENTELDSNNYSGNKICAVALSNNKVAIVFKLSSISIAICKIDGMDIEIEQTHILSKVASGDNPMSAVALSNNRIFIAYPGTASSQQLYAIICTVNEENIEEGTVVQLSICYNSGFSPKLITLNDNKVFILHFESNNYHLYAMLCDVTETEISVLSTKVVNSGTGTTEAYLAKISNDKVFIGYQAWLSNSLVHYGEICTIDNNEISLSTRTRIDNLLCNNIVALSDSKLIGVMRGTQGIDALIYNINDAEEIEIKQSLYLISGKSLAIVLLSKNRVLIIRTDGYTSLFGTICSITKDNVIAEEDKKLNGALGNNINNIITVKILDKILIAYPNTSSQSLNAYVCKVEDEVQQLQKIDNAIFGVATKKGTEGQIVDVVVPNI